MLKTTKQGIFIIISMNNICRQNSDECDNVYNRVSFFLKDVGRWGGEGEGQGLTYGYSFSNMRGAIVSQRI